MAKAILNLQENSGLLFVSAAGGKADGAIKIEDVYYEVKNSSTTNEDGRKILNVTLKKLGGRKAIDLHFTKSGFQGEKSPDYTTNQFVIDNVTYQVVAWHRKTVTGTHMLSCAVNEQETPDFFL